MKTNKKKDLFLKSGFLLLTYAVMQVGFFSKIFKTLYENKQ